jgi:predicted metal-binding membrane protein
MTVGAGPAGSAVRARRYPITSAALATYGALLILAVVAWWVSDLRMAGMDNGPGSPLGTFVFFLTTWVVMMAAMMFPSVAPMVATYVGIQRGRRRKALPAVGGASALFVGGYLLVWSFAGAAAFLVARVAASLAGNRVSWPTSGHWLAAAVLLAAAVYELTPLKQACLTRCRGPVSFLLTSWREGRIGALRMGAVHGAWCLGCCWALMAALFALGVMSLAWMAVIGLLIAVEKLAPWRRVATALVIAALLLLAAGIAFAPHHVPGLTTPDQMTSMT